MTYAGLQALCRAEQTRATAPKAEATDGRTVADMLADWQLIGPAKLAALFDDEGNILEEYDD